MALTSQQKSKITDSHGSATETAHEVVEIAAKLDYVHKIGFGLIRHVPKGRRALKYLPITGGIKAVVRGNGAVQDLFIYTKDVDGLMKELEEKFRIE
ncbi:MAG: hypothetical protein M3Q80_00435 [bacterium]|nr:hypothetical protein [bacterium]